MSTSHPTNFPTNTTNQPTNFPTNQPTNKPIHQLGRATPGFLSQANPQAMGFCPASIQLVTGPTPWSTGGRRSTATLVAGGSGEISASQHQPMVSNGQYLLIILSVSHDYSPLFISIISPIILLIMVNYRG